MQASPFFDMGGARTIILPFFLKKKNIYTTQSLNGLLVGVTEFYRVLPGFSFDRDRFDRFFFF